LKGNKKPLSYTAATGHLNEAQKALTEGYKPDKDIMKTVWGRVSEARRHLEAIGPESPAYIVARGLMNEVCLRERRIEIVCIDIAHQLMIKQREILADELGQYYLGRGILADIKLIGPDKTFLQLECPLLCETSVERIIDDTNFLEHLKRAGFRKVMLSNNEGYTRVCSVEKHEANNAGRTSVNRKNQKKRETKVAGNDRRE